MKTLVSDEIKKFRLSSEVCTCSASHAKTVLVLARLLVETDAGSHTIRPQG